MLRPSQTMALAHGNLFRHGWVPSQPLLVIVSLPHSLLPLPNLCSTVLSSFLPPLNFSIPSPDPPHPHPSLSLSEDVPATAHWQLRDIVCGNVPVGPAGLTIYWTEARAPLLKAGDLCPPLTLQTCHYDCYPTALCYTGCLSDPTLTFSQYNTVNKRKCYLVNFTKLV